MIRRPGDALLFAYIAGGASVSAVTAAQWDLWGWVAFEGALAVVATVVSIARWRGAL